MVQTAFQMLRSKIIHAKVFSQRGLSYISLVNSGMILFILLSNLEKYGIDIMIQKWFFPILIGGIFFLIFLGYLEDKLGMFSAEISVSGERNPQMQEILKRIKNIERRLR